MEDLTKYTMNVTEFSARNIPKVWKPNSLEELMEIVEKANLEKRSIYPISTGHNWGLGSKLPVEDTELVDLGMINEILEVNEELCYARIQPGVTQKQLADYLTIHHPSLMLNVTGSDANSSILGNTLERGSGKNGHRADDLRELKVLLADGSVISSGFGGMETQDKSYYSYGLGPDMKHLFTQSNFGVVVEGVINLMIKQPFHLFLTTVPDRRVKEFFGAFSQLVRKGIVGNSLELDSQNDPKIFELFEDTRTPKEKIWIGWFVIYGEGAIREAKTEVVKRELSPMLSELKIYHSEEKNFGVPIPVEVRLRRYKGTPSDHSLVAVAKSFGVELNDENLDIDHYKEMPGFRCVLPVLPFSEEAYGTLSFIETYSKNLSLDPAISVIGLNTFSLEVFCRVHFDRSNQEQIETAAEWAKGLLHGLKERGVFAYRLDIDALKSYLHSLQDPSQRWKKLLKEVFDPNNIISPGRYII